MALNSEPFEIAPGGPDRPELYCVGSTGGLSVHLLVPDAGEVLCRGLRSGRVEIGPSVPPFELSGCKRCAAVAVDLGYESVRGFDGARVNLADFQPLANG